MRRTEIAFVALAAVALLTGVPMTNPQQAAANPPAPQAAPPTAAGSPVLPPPTGFHFRTFQQLTTTDGSVVLVPIGSDGKPLSLQSPDFRGPDGKPVELFRSVTTPKGTYLVVEVPNEDRRPPAIATSSPSSAVDRSAIESPEWKRAIDTANSHMSRFGGQYSLMRVVLKDAAQGERIRVDATKLKDLTKDYHGGGGQFRDVMTGAFVFMEHINTSRRRNGKDPVRLDSEARGYSEVWIEVPEPGVLTVVGDIVVEPPSKQ